MTQSGSRDTVWQIPSGTLTYAGDGTVRAHIRAGLRSKAAVLPAVQAVASFLEPPFLGGVGYVHGDDGFTLTWMPTGSARIPLASVVATWRQQAALHIPRALDVAQTISQAVGVLHGRIPRPVFPLRRCKSLYAAISKHRSRFLFAAISNPRSRRCHWRAVCQKP